jgi:signal transduction histidine kinase
VQLPATEAVWSACAPTLVGGDLRWDESSAIAVWSLLNDSGLRRKLPRSWAAVSRRTWKSLLEQNRGATLDGSSARTAELPAVASACSMELARGLEDAAACRRKLIAEKTASPQEYQWYSFWANTWDADQWLQNVLGEAGLPSMPTWWREIRDAAPDELSSPSVVEYLLSHVTTDDFPTPLVSANGTDAEAWVSIADRFERLRELENEFDQRLEAAKLDALKEFAYGASHEINNPLANIAGRAQALLQDEGNPERRRALATIAAEAFRAHDMIGDVMLVARPPQLNIESTDIGQLLLEVADSREESLRCQQTEIRACSELSDPLTSWLIDPKHVRELLQLLVDNAAEALGQGGAICLTASASDDYLVLSVVDDGPGIPEEIRPRIFEPYFSGREAGRGLGIGLAKCWVIARQHGGEIRVESNPGRTEFQLLFPWETGELSDG